MQDGFAGKYILSTSYTRTIKIKLSLENGKKMCNKSINIVSS